MAETSRKPNDTAEPNHSNAFVGAVSTLVVSIPAIMARREQNRSDPPVQMVAARRTSLPH